MLHFRYTCVLLLLALILTPAFADDLAIDMGPMLGDLTPNSALLTWHTNKPSVAWVEVAGQKLGAGEATEFHRVRLEGLLPGRRYEYTVKANVGEESASAGPYRFRTPSPWLSRWRFAAYGDTRTHPDAHRKVVAAMAGVHPRLILNTGDLVATGTNLEHWHRFFPAISLLAPTIPYYPCLGNHERNADLYYQLLPLPEGGGDFNSEWATFVFGNCQFISLDSNRRREEQTEWLREVLAEPKPEGVDWRIVLFHSPPFTSGIHAANAHLPYLRENWCPLLEAGVDLVFCGHDHIYERSQHGGLYYITVGTGGAPLRSKAAENPFSQVFVSHRLGFCEVDVTRDELKVTFFSDELDVLDEFTVTHAARDDSMAD